MLKYVKSRQEGNQGIYLSAQYSRKNAYLSSNLINLSLQWRLVPVLEQFLMKDTMSHSQRIFLGAYTKGLELQK